MLDFEPDGIRAINRFSRVMVGLGKDTSALGKRLGRHTRRMARAMNASSQRKQRLANRAARSITTSAVYIEKRLDLLRKAVSEIERANRGLIAIVPLETPEQIEQAKQAREAIEASRTITAISRTSTEQYRDITAENEAANHSRSLRVASGRLATALSGIVTTLENYELTAEALVKDFDKRLKGL